MGFSADVSAARKPSSKNVAATKRGRVRARRDAWCGAPATACLRHTPVFVADWLRRFSLERRVSRAAVAAIGGSLRCFHCE
jgi:hypothetical protein